MRTRSSRIVRLAFVFSFVALVCLINFTHTEKGPASDVRCPACQFQQSALGWVLAAYVFLPLLVILVLLEANRSPDYEFHFSPRISSRSPPSA